MSHDLFGVAGLAVLFVLSLGPFRAFRRFLRRFDETSAGPSLYPSAPTDPAHVTHHHP